MTNRHKAGLATTADTYKIKLTATQRKMFEDWSGGRGGRLGATARHADHSGAGE